MMGSGTIAVANELSDLRDSETVKSSVENPQGIKTTRKVLPFDHSIQLHDAANFGRVSMRQSWVIALKTVTSSESILCRQNRR